MSHPAAELDRVEKELLARWPESRIEWKLERMQALMHALGDPQLAYQVVHLAGTNGKTSTARMVDALLRALDLRTGRYTSPHLESITERISVDGEPLSPERFVEIYDEISSFFELVDAGSDVRLSFFEAMTGMAFAAFADVPVDVAVVEVGMGGRLDATNIVQAQVAVITPVDLDHMVHLGTTIAQIAAEKAGIIKPGQAVVVAAQHPDAIQVVLAKANEVGANVVREGFDFGVIRRENAVGGQVLALRGLNGVYDEVFLPLYGGHQASNAACALAAVEALAGGDAALDADLVRMAFASVRSPGRLEVMRTSPTILVDATHNPAGAKATVAALGEAFAFRRLVGVIGTLADKDVRAMLEIYEPFLAHVVVTENSSARAMPADDLAEIAEEIFGASRVDVVPRLDEAIEIAVERADEDNDFGGAGVLVTGSVVTAGEARRMLARR
ncbi:MAG: dihydrofolate synthase / folylpolyglutamate synthase [Actinomycetota bacterium]|jgi:dihydrofolate synthase/folylpolyglutamate synthase|nr:dihydrofolate synthase / folylpolyglutamate synthase [Actinomycetota bacterium]